MPSATGAKSNANQQPHTGLVDDFGHGTHVAGIIGGTGDESTDEVNKGFATAAELFSLQVLDETGRGAVADVIAALDWVLQNAASMGIQVVNMSIGKAVETPAADYPLVQAVETVWDADIVVVVSAGNYGRDGHFTITRPGNSRKVITVGSLTDNGTGTDFSDDYVSTYSSRGPTLYDHILKPDLLAPGNRVVATTPDVAVLRTDLPDRVVACDTHRCEYGYLELSGTSMSSAVVAATAAMMLDADDSLSPDTIKARLMRTARKIDGDPTVVGAGVLDIGAVLEDDGEMTTSALSPLMTHGTADDGSEVVVVEDKAVIWGDAYWSAAYLWSDAVQNANPLLNNYGQAMLLNDD